MPIRENKYDTDTAYWSQALILLILCSLQSITFSITVCIDLAYQDKELLSSRVDCDVSKK